MHIINIMIIYFVLPLLLMNCTLTAFTASFVPPPNWQQAPVESLPKHVKLMVVGKGEHAMPPSINLGTEEYKGSMKEYLKIVKDFNASQGDVWKDLGTIDTLAGTASLSQVDMKTEWGPLRQMHVIFAKEGVVYILTAAALKDEFSKYYPEFFKALQSFQVN